MIHSMKRTRTVLFGFTVSVMLASSGAEALADAKANPYDAIVERNPFALKPPPPPAPPEDPSSKLPPAPLATVEVTGITSILSSKKVLLEIVPGPGKPMLKPILSEGERLDSIEVVSIDVEKNEVVIKNGGVTTNLTFKVVKSAPGPAGPAAPGAVPPPAVAGIPSAAAQPAFGNQDYSSPGRGVQVGGGATMGDGFRSIPSRNIRANAQAPVTAEGSVMELERNRAMNEHIRQSTGMRLPPLPPTALNPYPQENVNGFNDPNGLPQQPNGARPGWVPRTSVAPPVPGR